jgi:hypothetical protein
MTDETKKGCLDISTCPSPFDLQQSNDSQFMTQVVSESLDIGGADVNLFKLLGIHEQGKLIDLTGNGQAISSGDQQNFPASNVFETGTPEWRSLQKGQSVTASSYIGYDFGPIKLNNGRNKYGIETNENHHITTIRIKQSSNANNRATKARVEYSNDEEKWFGAAIIDLPDNAELNDVSFKTSSPARYWRLRPVEFNGSSADFWAICQIEMFNYKATRLDVLQDDMGFMESRDRDYSHEAITLKGSYDLIDVQTELTRFGIELPSQQFYLQISFAQCVEQLGRPIVIGDIIELPSEVQYTPTMEPIKKYLEVTDVGWSTEGYTPGWVPTLLRVITVPLMASQETMDLIGDFAPTPDGTGFLDIDDSQHTDITSVANSIEATAHTQVPEAGADLSDQTQISEEDIQSGFDVGVDLRKLRTDPNSLYVEDGLPPNGLPYTEGDTLPPISTANDGDYHRLTYAASVDIPPRLYKYSLPKGRWVYMETDMRFKSNNIKPSLQRILSSDTSTPSEDL